MQADAQHNLRRRTAWILMLGLVILLGACKLPGSNSNEGAVWLGDPVITTGFDENGDPVDAITELAYGVERAYCFLTIRGPENVVLGLRWFYEDQLVGETGIAFGTERKGFVDVINTQGGPLPRGRYRCDIYAVEEPLRSAEFVVK